MLSDEEKEAIELLEDYLICGNKEGVLCRNLRIISTIIEKQSKEIEHQKEKRENQKKELAILNAKQIEFNKLKNTVNSYKGQFKRQQKEIEELKNADLTTVYLNGFYDGEKKVKDKIKVKIEDILNSENSEAIEKLIEWQSLLEKE